MSETHSGPTGPHGLTVQREGDWLRVYDENGFLMGSSVIGFGPHAPAAVDVVATIMLAVSGGLHDTGVTR